MAWLRVDLGGDVWGFVRMSSKSVWFIIGFVYSFLLQSIESTV
jgi:hypothetical protein